MTETPTEPRNSFRTYIVDHPDRLIAAAVFLLTLALYISTLAPGVVFGDPSEYTFVPHIWGISHPPGYAFITVLGGIWQRLMPIGTIAYRANLLSAAAGAGIAALIYGSIRTLTPSDWRDLRAYAPALLGAGSMATAADVWQHSLHANSHILTALLAAASLFSLLRWWRSSETHDRWLYMFCVLTGLSITQHPLLVFSFPAYATFIIVTRPSILLEWRTLLKMIGFALLGLSVWLYLPIRAALGHVPFGPTNTNTLDGFLALVLVRGLTSNLFYFGLPDQPDRAVVFASLVRLQAGWIVIALMLIGLIWLWRIYWRVALLLTFFVMINLLFILNTIQDVMAYLLTPLTGLMLLASVGAIPILMLIHLPDARTTRIAQLAVAATLIAIPVVRGIGLADRISLRHMTTAQDWIDEVYDTFEGKHQGAILLAHWEHLTPLWYEAEVEGRRFDPQDLTLVFVATTSEHPWVDNTWANIDKGPIYVSDYEKELIDAGFRLRPVGLHLYRVLPAPAKEPAEVGMMLDAKAGPITVVGVDVPQTTVTQGGIIPLSIALHADTSPADLLFPYATFGETTYQFTTDSHWLTPYWQPDETIVERYNFRAPIDLKPGQYPLKIGVRNLSQGGNSLTFSDGSTMLAVRIITVLEASRLQTPEIMLADIDHQFGLVSASAVANGQRRTTVWDQPLIVHPGQDIHVYLKWAALSTPADNYKVFVHLMTGATTVVAQRDAPPLGGAYPTFLWFPKWIPGQTLIDPYRLTVPSDVPPGDYRIEVGMYGFNTFQRVPFYDPQGNLSGDFFILGPVRVEP